ncbi:MAG: TonB-dependent receptor, partial [Flavobacteriales bacterium]|nr:TonB-dependent receptor [Flavobacteriales bacterium]
MKSLFSAFLTMCSLMSIAQSGSIAGKLVDNTGAAVAYANVALYSSADSSMAKVAPSYDDGTFLLAPVDAGNYYLVASFVGAGEVRKNSISLAQGEELNLGNLTLEGSAINLEAASVVVERPLVEVKPDRTVFNVEGTINNTGDNALSLMRKAPGVTVDNNDNINVLGRAGVMLYVDGKQLPLSGDDLANYLKNLPSDQIDRIDIITNPGAKYDAEGNAGIIDIRLKKDKNLGANGSIRGTWTQGRYMRNNLNASGNYRNKRVNVFGTAGASKG